MDDATRRTAAELEDALLPLHATVKAMFGGYCYYVDRKVVGLVSDGRIFIKRSAVDDLVAPHAELAPAYPGAKDSWRVSENMQVRDPQALLELVAEVAHVLPPPRSTRRRLGDATS